MLPLTARLPVLPQAEGAQLELACAPGGVITAVTFAEYGQLSGACPSLQKGGCDADVSKAVASGCVGQSRCGVMCSHSSGGCCVDGKGSCCGCQVTSGAARTPLPFTNLRCEPPASPRPRRPSG